MAVDETKMQEIAKRYDELPEDVQNAYFSSETSDAIFEVGKKHRLEIDKMGELADETGLVMLGMTKPSEYIRNLEKRLEVEVTKAKEIAEDINQKVFSPIRESLKKIHGIIPSPPTTPIPPPNKETPSLYSPLKGGEIPNEVSPPLPADAKAMAGKQGGARGGTPSLLTNEKGLRVGVNDKVNQILRDHEALKQARKHVMPPQPEDIKVGEIAKQIEPKVEVKPLIGGRITTPPLPPLSKGGKERGVVSPPLQGGDGGGIPDIFVRNTPNNTPVTPDFVPPPKEPLPQGQKEAKNLLEKAVNDPYKEPI